MSEEVTDQRTVEKAARRMVMKRRGPGDLYQVVVECRDEAEQRELFERMNREGRRVRLLVL